MLANHAASMRLLNMRFDRPQKFCPYLNLKRLIYRIASPVPYLCYKNYFVNKRFFIVLPAKAEKIEFFAPNSGMGSKHLLTLQISYTPTGMVSITLSLQFKCLFFFL